MDSNTALSTILVSSFGAVVILISAFNFLWKAPRRFNVPTVGLGEADNNTLKLRYVQEADVLLREGYHKVATQKHLFAL